MRTILMTLVVVGLLVAPSFGAIDVTVSSNKASILVGETAVITLSAKSTTAGIVGIASMGGNINAAGVGDLSSAGFAWVPFFNSPAPFPAVVGGSLVKGGWGPFGSQQTSYLPADPTFGDGAMVTLATYTVTGVSPGLVTLSFLKATVGGFKPAETSKAIIMGVSTAGTVLVTIPEPATMVLLALGGLLAARRRRV